MNGKYVEYVGFAFLGVLFACGALPATTRPSLEVVSGGMKLAWTKPAADDPLLQLVPVPARAAIVVATVPGQGELPGFAGGFGQPSSCPYWLFDGAERLPITRVPDKGFFYVAETAADFDHHSGNENRPKPPTLYFKSGIAADAFAALARERDLWARGCWKYGWADTSLEILEAAVSNLSFKVSTKHIPYGIRKGAKDGGYYYLVNAFSALDTPGEWAADRANRRIYLYPPTHGTTGIEVAMKDTLLTLKAAKDLVIEGKTFENCRRTAIELDACTNVTIRRSIVRNAGADGIRLTRCVNCRVEGCDLYNLGEGGVYVNGGQCKTLTPGGNVVENCHIHDIGKWVYNYRPGVSLMGCGNRCAHNLIHHVRHAGVIFGGNDQYIGWNVIHDVCRDNFDCGAVYAHTKTDWSDRGSVVERNCVHITGTPGFSRLTMGIYVDGWSSGTTVRDNIVNGACQGLFQNSGHGNTWVRNIALNCDDPLRNSNLGLRGGKKPTKGFPHPDRGSESVLYGNFVKFVEKCDRQLWESHYPGFTKVLDVADKVLAHGPLWYTATNNVFAWSGAMRISDAEFLKDYYTIAGNETVDDPGFRDFENFDWELRKDAPARRILGGGTRFAEMGLYASPHRVSPAVKFGENATPPKRGK